VVNLDHGGPDGMVWYDVPTDHTAAQTCPIHLVNSDLSNYCLVADAVQNF